MPLIDTTVRRRRRCVGGLFSRSFSLQGSRSLMGVGVNADGRRLEFISSAVTVESTPSTTTSGVASLFVASGWRSTRRHYQSRRPPVHRPGHCSATVLADACVSWPALRCVSFNSLPHDEAFAGAAARGDTTVPLAPFDMANITRRRPPSRVVKTASRPSAKTVPSARGEAYVHNVPATMLLSVTGAGSFSVGSRVPARRSPFGW